jgi:hypothetical protein
MSGAFVGEQERLDDTSCSMFVSDRNTLTLRPVACSTTLVIHRPSAAATAGGRARSPLARHAEPAPSPQAQRVRAAGTRI